jgi:hypothetical protein
MGVQRTSFGKLHRERNKKAKQEAKRSRREERANADPELDTSEAAPGDELAPLSPEELLRMVALVHESFEAGKIGPEEFEEKKTELLARLPVD